MCGFGQSFIERRYERSARVLAVGRGRNRRVDLRLLLANSCLTVTYLAPPVAAMLFQQDSAASNGFTVRCSLSADASALAEL